MLQRRSLFVRILERPARLRTSRGEGQAPVITPCKFVYPYFNNPEMLEFQVANWNRYDSELRAAVEIIVVDDHSSTPALPILERCEVSLRAYRLAERFPWNMHECRNIGAKEACTAAENAWLFMCDIDTVLEPEMAVRMLTKDLDSAKYYTMDVVYPSDPTARGRSKNMFLVRHAAFWQVNGYDLDLNPIGGGGYGGARQFIKQLKQVVLRDHLDDVVLVDYSARARDASGQKIDGPGARPIGDADTREIDRDYWVPKFKEALRRKQQSGARGSVNPIRTEFARVL
jgi:hypothetical protein